MKPLDIRFLEAAMLIMRAAQPIPDPTPTAIKTHRWTKVQEGCVPKYRITPSAATKAAVMSAARRTCPDPFTLYPLESLLLYARRHERVPYKSVRITMRHG